MKFFLRYVSSPEVGMSECVKLAQKLDYCVVNDANQLFAVGMELLGAAKKVNPAAELVVNNSKEGVLLCDFEYIEEYIRAVRELLEDDGKWDTSSMIDALGDATRLVNGLLGRKKGGLK